MNIMAITTTLPHTAASGEPIGLFHSICRLLSAFPQLRTLGYAGRRDVSAHLVSH